MNTEEHTPLTHTQLKHLKKVAATLPPDEAWESTFDEETHTGELWWSDGDPLAKTRENLGINPDQAITADQTAEYIATFDPKTIHHLLADLNGAYALLRGLALNPAADDVRNARAWLAKLGEL